MGIEIAPATKDGIVEKPRTNAAAIHLKPI
jgi:hypothetical protein